MEERKTNTNISSEFILLKEKHFLLKRYLDELNKSTTTRILLRRLATEMFFQEKVRKKIVIFFIPWKEGRKYGKFSPLD